LSNLALWREITVFWGLILEKVGQKPDFWARSREIRPFLAAILPENANQVEITAQNAAIYNRREERLRIGSTMLVLMHASGKSAGIFDEIGSFL